MSCGIGGIDRISVAVGIRLLCQHGVPGDESSDLCVVEPAPHQRQAHIALTPVARGCPEPVGARAASRARHRLAERRERQAGRHCLAGVRHRPLTAEAIEQWRLPVLGDERVSAGCKCSSEPLLLPSSRDHISR